MLHSIISVCSQLPTLQRNVLHKNGVKKDVNGPTRKTYDSTICIWQLTDIELYCKDYCVYEVGDTCGLIYIEIN